MYISNRVCLLNGNRGKGLSLACFSRFFNRLKPLYMAIMN